MPYAFFHSRFPTVARRETRTITVFPKSEVGLPAGDYGFLEMFCDEHGCDCRRAFFYVVSSLRKDVEAVISWGWEDRSFYAKWMGDNDPDVLATLKGPALNPGSPQTDLAPAVLSLVATVLLRDSEFVQRVKKHYRMFRDHVANERPNKGAPSDRSQRAIRARSTHPRGGRGG